MTENPLETYTDRELVRLLSSRGDIPQVEAELVFRLDGAIRELDRLLAEHDALLKRLHDAQT